LLSLAFVYPGEEYADFQSKQKKCLIDLSTVFCWDGIYLPIPPWWTNAGEILASWAKNNSQKEEKAGNTILSVARVPPPASPAVAFGLFVVWVWVIHCNY
jgi:hypothetical protein